MPSFQIFQHPILSLMSYWLLVVLVGLVYAYAISFKTTDFCKEKANVCLGFLQLLVDGGLLREMFFSQVGRGRTGESGCSFPNVRDTII